MVVKNQKKIGIVLSYLVIVTSMISGFIFTPFIIRCVGQAEYGLYQLVSSFVGYLMVLDFGLGNTITRYVSKFRAEKDKKGEENFLYMGIIIYAIISIIMILVGLVLFFNINNIFSRSLSIYQINKAKVMFLIMMITFAISLFSNAYAGVIIAYERFIYSNVSKISKIILRLMLLIVLLNNYKNSLAIVSVDFCIVISFLMLDIFYTHGILNIRFRKYYFDKILFKETLVFSFFIFLQIIINQVNTNVDPLLLGIMTNTKVVAVYSLGIQIYLIYCTMSTAISTIYLPSVSKMVVDKASNDDLIRYIITPSRIQLMILGWILCGFIVIGQEFIILWVGEGFKTSWWVCILIMIPSTIELSQNVILNILKAKNKIGFRSIVNVFVAILNVCLSIVLIKCYGAIGGAIGTSISLIIGYIIISNIYYHRVIKLDMKLFFFETYRGILPTIVLTTITSLVIIQVHSNSVFSFILNGIIISVIYLLLLINVGMNHKEKEYIKQSIRRHLVFIK